MNQNSLFQITMDNALEIILIFDVRGKIVYANRAAEKLLEYKDGFLGYSIADVFPGEFRMERGFLEMEYGVSDEIRTVMAYRSNHTCFPVRGKLLWYKDEQRYLCMAQDVSDEIFLEKKANQAVQEAEQALKVKSEFVANVTHELRTPVNGILGNTQELIGFENEEKKLKLLHLVERGCKDMHALINNILDFSKLEAGKFVLEPRKFEFRNMIDYVKGNHSNRIIEKGLEFVVTVSPEIPDCVIGDELRIVQILNNLISNAYKFTSVGGIDVEVVKTAQSGNRAELFFMVIDTGIGIAKTDQDKLFKSFSQVDASISRKYGGTGLGLNICKQLVELMGGDIHVESEKGKGTIFSFHIWVEIPEEEYRTAVDESNQDEEAVVTPRTSEQILLRKLESITESNVGEKIFTYGEPENIEEIEKKMSKLILSVEMENWEKAEMFAETVKQLVEDAPREVKSAALRLKMAVQKGDYEKAVVAFETLQKCVN